MTFLALGFSHRQAPIELLEQLAVPADLMPKALASVIQRDHVEEAVVISTCNRVEVYANVTRFHGGIADLRNHFAEWSGLDPASFAHLAHEHFDRDAATHLFRVASGLDSMVVGERQIHSQLRQAFRTAIDEGTAGSVLNRVFRQAVRVGRRARTETGLADGASSMVDLALATARQELQTPTPRVLIIGAGKMGGMAGSRVVDQAATVAVANRTPHKAEDLVSRLETGTAHGLDEIPALLRDADLVITSTDATRPLVTTDDLRAAMLTRAEPIVLVDLAVPRDVEAGAHEIDGVSLIDVEALRGVVHQGPTGDAVRKASQIVEAEVEDFVRWTRGVQAGPTIAAMRRRAEDVRRGELDRLKAKLAGLDEQQREAVEAVTKGILNTLLHEPTVRLKGMVDTPDGERYVRALSHLFDLDSDDDAAAGRTADADGKLWKPEQG